jgi:hypothetical protein
MDKVSSARTGLEVTEGRKRTDVTTLCISSESNWAAQTEYSFGLATPLRFEKETRLSMFSRENELTQYFSVNIHLSICFSVHLTTFSQLHRLFNIQWKVNENDE